jgi:hypothetical protein
VALYVFCIDMEESHAAISEQKLLDEMPHGVQFQAIVHFCKACCNKFQDDKEPFLQGT